MHRFSCRALTPSRLHRPAPRPTHRTMPPFDSAASVGVQPAAELRHVQRHNHARHVCGALHATLPPPHLPTSTSTSPPRRACRLRRRRPTPSRLPAHTSPHIACLPSARQHASAFNQPLNFDTSSVTIMSYMFLVRTPRPLPASISVGSSPCMFLRDDNTLPPPALASEPHTQHHMPNTYARLSARQFASAFNQPLSFDTSSVTSMDQMFGVYTLLPVPCAPYMCSPALSCTLLAPLSSAASRQPTRASC